MASSSAAPRVILSQGALERNARELLSDGGIVDLRHDAYGHGLERVARVVTDAGAESVLVDDPQALALLSAAGIRASLEDAPSVDPHRLLGVPEPGASEQTDPVMRLDGRVMSTKPLRAGEAVSYGYTHRAAQDTRVALVTGGYAQGVLRALGNRARVQIGDSTHPIVGRIAMDVCVVDLDGADVRDDTSVTFFGGTGPMRDALARWSAATGLSAMEMAVVIGRHANREWSA